MEIKTDIGPAATSNTEGPGGIPYARKSGAGIGTASGDKQVQPAAREPVNVAPIPTRDLNLQVDNELKLIIASVVDKETGNVIRQIPSSESIAIARHTKEQLDRMDHHRSGLLVNKEA
ncbi:MAG: flagellar protein FlaG [Desulfobacteria bacterium]